MPADCARKTRRKSSSPESCLHCWPSSRSSISWCRSTQHPTSSISSSRCGGLRLEEANVRDEAAPAFGPARLADIAPVQNKPVMGVALVAIGHDLLESRLHFKGRFTGG